MGCNTSQELKAQKNAEEGGEPETSAIAENGENHVTEEMTSGEQKNIEKSPSLTHHHINGDAAHTENNGDGDALESENCDNNKIPSDQQQQQQQHSKTNSISNSNDVCSLKNSNSKSSVVPSSPVIVDDGKVVNEKIDIAATTDSNSTSRTIAHSNTEKSNVKALDGEEKNKQVNEFAATLSSSSSSSSLKQNGILLVNGHDDKAEVSSELRHAAADVNDKPETDEAIAATKIQAAFRGHQVRATMKKSDDATNSKNGAAEAAVDNSAEPTKEELEAEFDPNDKELCDAALKIQSTFRGHLSRKLLNKDEPEDVDIQEITKKVAEELDIDLTDPELNKAATKIQASFRGHKSRRDVSGSD